MSEAATRARLNLLHIANKLYNLEVDENENYSVLMDKISKKFFSFAIYKYQHPHPSCKECYGRGFLIRTQARPTPCKCLKMKAGIKNNG